MKRTSCIVVILVSVMVFTGSFAFNATDGSLGTTSSGKFTIDVAIPTLVRVSGFDDINFGSYAGSGDKTDNRNLCVYTNLPAATYKVKGEGDGVGLAFTVTSGSSTTAIPYHLYWNDQASAGTDELTTTVYLSGQTGANTSAADCGGAKNSNIKVTMLAADLQAAPAGTYAGIATITVAPI